MPKIAFFSYSWDLIDKTKLDHYQKQFVKTLKDLNCDVDIYIGNEYTADRAVNGSSSNINWGKFCRYLESKNYDWVLSFNCSLIKSDILASLKCPVSIVLLDEFKHLFKFDNPDDIYFAFRKNVVVFASSYEFVKNIRDNIDNSDNVHYLPTATSKSCALSCEATNEIVLVASYLDCNGLSLLIDSERHNKNNLELIADAIKNISENSTNDQIVHSKPFLKILTKHKWSQSFFNMQVENSISNRERIELVSKLADRGLKLYGNSAWLYQISMIPNLLNFYVPGDVIESHDDLINIYNTSKISVNISQHQAGNALPFRVIDIMASRSLLITKYNPNSELYKIFGDDCPVPTYKNTAELLDLCDYYSRNDSERIALVDRCNALVSEGFDFQTRVMQYANYSSYDLIKSKDLGTVSYVKASSFQRFISVLTAKEFLRDIVRSIFSLIPVSIRWKISNQLRF